MSESEEVKTEIAAEEVAAPVPAEERTEEGKPVGPATIVDMEATGAEQFPGHEADTSK